MALEGPRAVLSAAARAPLTVVRFEVDLAVGAARAVPGAASAGADLARRAARLAPTPVELVQGGVRLVPSTAALGREVADLLTPRRRRVWVSDDGRAHVELRQLGPDELDGIAPVLESALVELPGVEWAEVNPFTSRVVVAGRDGEIDLDTVLPVVELAERDAGLDDRPFPVRAHPADREASALATLELGIDATALVISLIRRATRSDGDRPLLLDAARLVMAVQYLPQVRTLVERRVRGPLVDLGVTVLGAGLHAAGGRPLGPVVGLVQHGVALSGAQARQHAWRDREPELCDKPSDTPFARLLPPPRPPVPDGPVERAERRIPPAALAAAGASVPILRSRERTAGLLATAGPRAAVVGRRLLTDGLVRILARRGAVVLDPDALVLLDRVDTALVTGEALVDDRLVADVVAVGDGPHDVDGCWAAAEALVDGADLDDASTSGAWSLGPLDTWADHLDGDAWRRAARLATDRHAVVLGLAHHERVVALVVVRPALRPGATHVLGAIHRAGLELVVATTDTTVARALGAHRTVPPGPGLAGAVRSLQSEGRVVWLTGEGPPDALEAADVALGLPHPLSGPPWAADVIGHGLDDAAVVADACRVARDTAEQNSKISVGGSVTGGLLAVASPLPGATARAVTAVEASALLGAANALRGLWSLEHRPAEPDVDPTPWHALTVDDVLDCLGTRPSGLTSADATARRVVPPAPTPPPIALARTVLEEAWNPLTPVLLAGAGLSWAVGSITDAAVVSAVIGLDAASGGIQRFRAEQAVARLAATGTQLVHVRRDGVEVQVAADHLVAGDVLVLAAGERVPADCRVLRTDGAEVDESSLTGEAALVTKSSEPTRASAIGDRSSMLFADTVVAVGEVEAVVVATGAATESGRAGALAALEPPPATGLESRLEELTRITIPTAALAGGLVAGLGLLRRQPMRDVLSTGVSLAVAAVPEGLPLIATVSELAASRRLSRRGVLVRRPSTVEALGRVDVLCADKTGTLTEGRLRFEAVADDRVVVDAEGLDTGLAPRWAEVLRVAGRATPRDEGRGLVHPTDRAVLTAVEHHALVDDGAPLATLPFDPQRGYHAALRLDDGVASISVKGAPEAVLPRCTSVRRRDGTTAPLGDAGRRHWDAAVERLAGDGHRVLAVAVAAATDAGALTDDDVAGLTLVGLLALGDPLRPTAREAVAALAAAGVEVLMVTGDHPATARYLAVRAGILRGADDDRLLTGAEVDDLGDDELAERVADVKVVARTTPAHKVRIVRALQHRGHTVAMIGDGANDTAPIRQAEVGIAMGRTSTWAVRTVADLIVLDDGLDTVVEAVAEGRAMWRSVREAVAVLLGHNLGEIGYTVVGTALGGTAPLNGRQLLLVNLLTDVIPTAAIAARPSTEASRAAVLAAGPQHGVDAGLTQDLVWRGAATVAGASLGWGIGRMTGTPERARTIGLASLVGTQLAQTVLAGGANVPTIAAAGGSAALLGVVIQTPGLSQLFGCRPIGPVGWATAGVSAAAATGALVVLPPVVDRWRGRSA